MPRQFIIRKTAAGEWENVKQWKQHLADLPPGRYKVNELVPYKQRSLNQNSWFHVVLPAILAGLQEIGYSEIKSVDQAKAFVKSLFFRVVYTNGIDVVEVIQGTSETDKTDFASKADEIINWAREYLGIDIAPPGQQTAIDYYLPAAVASYDREAGAVIVEQA